MASFDFKKLNTMDRVLVGAAGVTFISLFLPWYGWSAGSYSLDVNGWSTSYGWLGALLIIAAGVYLMLQRSGVDLTKMPAGPAVIVLGLASLGTLIVVLRWLTVPRHSYFGGAISYGPRVGMILAVIAGVVEVVCAVSQFRSSGEKLPWDRAA